VRLNLAYFWFCRLGLEGDVPDHSTFSKNRHGRLRDSDLLRRLFEQMVRRCMDARLVGGERFAVDTSLIEADASRQACAPGVDGVPPEASSRAVEAYLAVLDEAAFGAATPVPPKMLSPADPASRWTGADGGLAYFAYCTNYLIDLDDAVIVDVEACTAVRQAQVAAAKTMIERTRRRGLVSGRNGRPLGAGQFGVHVADFGRRAPIEMFPISEAAFELGNDGVH
jgi:IS5 family transposase